MPTEKTLERRVFLYSYISSKKYPNKHTSGEKLCPYRAHTPLANATILCSSTRSLITPLLLPTIRNGLYELLSITAVVFDRWSIG